MTATGSINSGQKVQPSIFRAVILLLAPLLSIGLPACGSVNAPLPDLAQKPAPVMTAEEQAEAIADMTRQQASHEQKAIEEIERQRDI